MNRAKQENATKEVNATDMFFTIPESLSHLVLHDTGTDDRNRIITLGHQDLLPGLEKELLFGDGTFDVVPSIFYQLYTVSAKLFIIKLVT